MKKTSKSNIGKSFVEKAVVLAIVAVFIGSAFVPAVGSQIKDIITNQPVEDEKILIGEEESVGDTYEGVTQGDSGDVDDSSEEDKEDDKLDKEEDKEDKEEDKEEDK